MATALSSHHRKVESLRTVLRLAATGKKQDEPMALDDLFDQADRVYDWIDEGPTARRERMDKKKQSTESMVDPFDQAGGAA